MTETRRHAAAAACAAVLLALSAAGPAGAAPVPNTTERVTLGATSAQLAGGGDVLAVSDDGCLALIGERHDAIAPGDANGSMDAFVRDCDTGAVELVSVDPEGDIPPLGVSSVTMTGDGRYVAFVARGSEWSDSGPVYIRDRVTDTTRLAPGPEWAGWFNYAALDPSGRYLALVYAHYLFRVDLQDDTSAWVDGAWGVEFPQLSTPISSDGDVVFSNAYALLPEDTDQDADVYVADRSSGTVSLLVPAESTAHTASPSISSNGRYVTFPGLVPGETGVGAWLVDRDAGTLVRADRAHDGSAPEALVQMAGSVSDTCDVAYESLAEDILAADANVGQNGSDVYVWDCATDETVVADVTSGGVQADGFTTSPMITADGRHVAFIAEAANLVAGDTNGAWDGFVRHLPAPGD